MKCDDCHSVDRHVMKDFSVNKTLCAGCIAKYNPDRVFHRAYSETHESSINPGEVYSAVVLCDADVEYGNPNYSVTFEDDTTNCAECLKLLTK